MKVLVIDSGSLKAQELNAACVVVMRDDGTPFMVAGELRKDLTLFAHANDADFQNALNTLGIDATVVVDKLRVS